MQVTITVNGDKQLMRNLRIFVDRMDNMKGFFSDLLDTVGERSDSIFKAQGSNVEKAPTWKGLASSTLLARMKRWGYYKRAPSNPGILRWTGALQQNTTKTPSDRFGTLTFNQPYASFHQEGGGRLPQRVVIDLDNATNAEIVRLMQKKVNDEIGISGLQV